MKDKVMTCPHCDDDHPLYGCSLPECPYKSSRQQHLDWCKQRAFEYLDQNEPNKAWTSFMCDMDKHDDTRHHSSLFVGMEMVLCGHLNSCEKMRKYIDGFQ